MRREDLRELHNITYVEHVRSSLIRGIYCWKRASALEHSSFALETVQERRDHKRVPGGLPLHEYANLYFSARNAALFRVLEDAARLCVLRVSTDVLDLPGIVVSDRNAASYDARFWHGASGIEHLDRKRVYAMTWRHADNPEEERMRKQMMCAEVLAPERVPGEYVFGVYVSCEKSRKALTGLVPERAGSIDVNPELFFQQA